MSTRIGRADVDVTIVVFIPEIDAADHRQYFSSFGYNRNDTGIGCVVPFGFKLFDMSRGYFLGLLV